MSALICGSIAYDTIMLFHDKFKNRILPDKMPTLNVPGSAAQEIKRCQSLRQHLILKGLSPPEKSLVQVIFMRLFMPRQARTALLFKLQAAELVRLSRMQIGYQVHLDYEEQSRYVV